MTATRKKQIYVVGNGPIGEDMSAAVDAADFVLRFNEPKEAIGLSGTRTDWLFISNAGKPMQRRLATPSYAQSPIVQAASRVFLVNHPDIIRKYHRKPNVLSRLKGRRADWTLASIEMFGRAGKEVVILPPDFYDGGCQELEIPVAQRSSVFPSTGYFGIRYLLRAFDMDEWRVDLCGFTWEGWRRHAWGDERRWVENLVEQGVLTVRF